METAKEITINVPDIEPRLKHQTIFQTFNHLAPGESMIIHNNHDPRPVYYQLQGIYGDVFTWEYLQEGPEWWDIRVTKANTQQENSQKEEVVINVQEIEPRFRHQTIFDEFDQLKEGESLIIHNNHDPKPVYYQLQQLKGDVFDWEYLEEGPQWWDIKVTRRKAIEQKSFEHPEENGEVEIEAIVINVQEIEPRLRHSTIFQAFDEIQPGEHLVIHNNHDPKPVYHQMQQLRGDTFDWEYLQTGPEWWDVLVTKREEEKPQGIAYTHQGEIMVTVPEIEPRMKHETIFQTFENLKPGGSMIIHNDHDPKPVYYQLKSMHGETFTWSYLQEGPEWWDIRVAKNEEKELSWEEQVGHALSKNEQSDTIINIPELQPKLKHPTIFKVFEDLKEGQSLVIHNDHDPKPVYYQLLGEYGNIFTWNYIQEGPIWWDIRVTKNNSDDTESIGEISAKDLRKAEVFKKYGIDFSCGGDKTLKQACDEKGLDAEKVEKELNQPIENVLTNQLNYQEWEVDFLSDYILNIHHRYARKYLPELKQYATKVAEVHGDKHPELLPLKEKVEKLHADLNRHLAEEEKVIFPLVKRILEAKNENKTYLRSENGNFGELVKELEKEHHEFISTFKEIHQLTNEFEIPEDACTSYTLLFNMLKEFENDLQLHFHIENNILFPKTTEIEKTLV